MCRHGASIWGGRNAVVSSTDAQQRRLRTAAHLHAGREHAELPLLGASGEACGTEGISLQRARNGAAGQARRTLQPHDVASLDLVHAPHEVAGLLRQILLHGLDLHHGAHFLVGRLVHDGPVTCGDAQSVRLVIWAPAELGGGVAPCRSRKQMPPWRRLEMMRPLSATVSARAVARLSWRAAVRCRDEGAHRRVARRAWSRPDRRTSRGSAAPASTTGRARARTCAASARCPPSRAAPLPSGDSRGTCARCASGSTSAGAAAVRGRSAGWWSWAHIRGSRSSSSTFFVAAAFADFACSHQRV